jgi:predicted enzyme involved in methoxymalonyl-ACP biosynthesis
MIEQANLEIIEMAEQTGSYLLDAAALAERAGTDRWFDPVRWLAYKLPFSTDCFAIYADTLGRLLGAIRGKSRKCLVLDLDNTIWGGVIGDDGMEGIYIGQGSAKGEAFLAVQETALEASCLRRVRRIPTPWRASHSGSIPTCSCARNISACSRPTGSTRRAISRRSPKP